MSQLAQIAVIVGLLLLVLNAVMILFPRQVNIWITGFPRNKWAGRILAAVNTVLITVLLLQSDIKWVEHHKLLVLLMAPVVLVLIVVFMDDLLAARALGGLFLLAPLPILDAAFVYPSNSRLFMTVFAYVLVVLGIVWVWSPFMFRKMTSKWVSNPRLSRAAGIIGVSVGLAMILLGVIVY